MDPKDPANPGDTATPPVAEPAASAAPAEPSAPLVPSAQPNGSEPDTNPGNGEPAMVPSDRLREETEKRRKAEEDFDEYKKAHPDEPAPVVSQNPDDELDPDVVDLVSKSAKKLGFVTQEELAAERAQDQVRRDVSDLIATPPVAGVPFDDKAVMEYASENGLPITSKNALVAAYRSANWDKIMEAERQRAIDGFKSGNSSGAERPGSSGASPPAEPEIQGKSPKERTRERIRLAREKLTI